MAIADEMNARAQEVDKRLTVVVREIGEYETGRKKCDLRTLQRELLRLRKQELSLMRELQQADPSFRPIRMVEGIENLELKVSQIQASLDR
ncbi:hypothetical protein AB0D10_43780 [Kitasatospora sp. NPDC048545]|uniref:hypothetical protein n=1 Tax=Kitasatospora sp. NPDC048545 TaxID=3157208 RepID=UPI0033D36CAD